MRVPLARLYRAFPELDVFTDAECERYVLQVRTQRRIGGRPAVATIATAIVLLLFVFPLVGSSLASMRWKFQSAQAGAIFFCLAIVIAVAVPGLVGLSVRDWLLIRAIRDRINNARCGQCRQSLLGLPLLPEMARDSVRCPECGSIMILEELGLKRQDLQPSAAPSAPADQP